VRKKEERKRGIANGAEGGNERVGKVQLYELFSRSLLCNNFIIPSTSSKFLTLTNPLFTLLFFCLSGFALLFLKNKAALKLKCF
jgi:hypothetical protein